MGPPDAAARGSALLAVDLGLRTGLAVYGGDGRLRSYGSRNFGSRSRLKRATEAVLREVGPLAWVVTEGVADLARMWERAAARHGAGTLRVAPERWRGVLLHPSERRRGADAKQQADHLARTVIRWSGAAKPTALRHDAAEAILVGLWGCVEVGLLDGLPPPLQLPRR
jgi:hypothetical protein